MDFVVAGLLAVIAGLLGWGIKELRYSHRLSRAIAAKQLGVLDGILNVNASVRDILLGLKPKDKS